MDPSHLRGLQVPTSHFVPGAPGMLGQPPPVLPAIFLAETISAIRRESAGQARLINDQYSSIARGYAEMNSAFESHFRQTDRILLDHHTHFERILTGVRNDTRQICENQTATITDLGARLTALEAAAEATRGELTSKFTSLTEAMRNGFAFLATMIRKNEDVAQDPPPPENEVLVDGPPAEAMNFDDSPPTGDTECEHRSDAGGVKEVLPPAIDSQTGLEGDTRVEQQVETPAAAVSPSATSDFDLEITPVEDLFDPVSPLTPVSSPRSQDWGESQTPIASPEEPVPTPPTPVPSNATRKRKRGGSRRTTVKSSRRRRESHPQEGWENVSGLTMHVDEDRADPSIWPPTIEEGANPNDYVICDQCAKWFHHCCVGLQGVPEDEDEDEFPWKCPLCVRDPTRNANTVVREVEKCSRPGCRISNGDEYFMVQLLGRCYVSNKDEDTVKYLVEYHGWTLDNCTWEPPENLPKNTKKIDELLKSWASENPGVDIDSLGPHATILLHEAYTLARQSGEGVKTWLGA